MGSLKILNGFSIFVESVLKRGCCMVYEQIKQRDEMFRQVVLDEVSRRVELGKQLLEESVMWVW